MLTGGRAPEYLRLDRRVIALVRVFAAEHKPIAAICHGVQVLAAADVIRGRRVSGYAACAPEVRLAGGEYVETPPDGAIRDGNLVTGFAWPAHPQWLSLFLLPWGRVWTSARNSARNAATLTTALR
jgi:protease I